MHQSISFIVLFLLSSLSFGQFSPQDEEKLDSLIQISSSDALDSVKIRAELEIAKLYKPVNPDTALTILRSLSGKAQNFNLGRLETLAYEEMGYTHRIKRQYDSTLHYMHKARSHYENGGSKVKLSKTYYNIGLMSEILGRFDSALIYYKDNVRIYTELGMPKEEGDALHNIGMYFYLQGKNDEAMKYYEKAVPKRLEADDKLGLGYTYNNIGTIYKETGRIDKAIDYYHRCMKVKESINDYKGLGTSLSNLAVLYQGIDDYDKSLEYHRLAMAAHKKEDFLDGIARELQGLGTVYRSKGDLDSALYYYNEAIAIYSSFDGSHEEYSTQAGLATCYAYTAVVYFKKDRIDTARLLLDKAISLAEGVNALWHLATAHDIYGTLEFDQGNTDEAIRHAKASLEYSKKSQFPSLLRNANQLLYKATKRQGKFDDALAYYESYIEMRDSLDKEENQKQVIRQEYQYEYEKQAAADSVKSAQEARVKDAEIAKQNAEIKAKQNEQYMLYGGLSLVILFSVFIFNRFRITNQQKKVIEEQRDVVEEKNKEILDSINYAKRLQDAILPAPKLVKEYLAESFILYKPKDIVAGDFYWLETLRQAQGDAESWTYIAAADCTGHGVPGAMVSVVCANALTKALVEEGITDTGKLLDRTRELVIAQFAASDEEIKDGMDISLAAIRHDGKQVRWSGANNPLWVLRNNDGPALRQAQGDPHSELRTTNSELLHEVKPDKQPIGRYASESPFTQHTIDLNEGDTLYMFSDGYPDQFGGDKGKKYKSGKMKKFLLSIQDKSMSDQKRLLDEEFESWRGDLEQIDDVCVVGIRI